MKFSKKNRLLVRKEFQSVFAGANKATSSFLIALYCPNSRSYPRLGLLINKQRVKLAVDRNQIRRVIRESFRQKTDNLQAIDIIVMIRGSQKAWDKREIRQAADELWKKLEHCKQP